MKNKIDVYYDDEGDFLELSFDDVGDGYSVDIKEGVSKRINEKTGKIVGVSILGFKKRTRFSDDMKFSYDKDTNVAYIYLKYPIEHGEAKKSLRVNNDLLLDFDKNEELMGIEIMNANKVLNKTILQDALVI